MALIGVTLILGVDGEVSVRNVDGTSSVLELAGTEVGKKVEMSDVLVDSSVPVVVSSVGRVVKLGMGASSDLLAVSGLVAVSVGISVTVRVVVLDHEIRVDDSSSVELGMTGEASVELGVSIVVTEMVSLGTSVKDAVGVSEVSDWISDCEVLDGTSLAV